jgi:hypothetical protein
MFATVIVLLSEELVILALEIITHLFFHFSC